MLARQGGICYNGAGREVFTMSEKRFAGPDGILASPELEADFHSARKIDCLWVGQLGVYYRDGLRRYCVPYARMERAFIRVQQVRGRMCCGQADFLYYRLVIVVDGGEIDRILSEDGPAMDEALAAIQRAAPQVSIGFTGKTK